jgi:hypothetical protein
MVLKFFSTPTWERFNSMALHAGFCKRTGSQEKRGQYRNSILGLQRVGVELLQVKSIPPPR